MSIGNVPEDIRIDRSPYGVNLVKLGRRSVLHGKRDDAIFFYATETQNMVKLGAYVGRKRFLSVAISV